MTDSKAAKTGASFLMMSLSQCIVAHFLPVLLLLLMLVIYFAVLCPQNAKAAPVPDWDSYLKDCEKKISEDWLKHEVSAFQIPYHFQENAKGAVSFYMDSEGRISKAKILHSSGESLRVAALRIYSVRGLGLLKAMDNAMVCAVEKSAPLPAPPWKLNCPRKFVVVFDTQRLKPLRMYVDDKIPIYQTSIPQVFF